MNVQPIRVVKVGGSLFRLENLADRLQSWLASQSPAVNILLAGGGPLADMVRDWDTRFSLDEEKAHWFCIDLMSVTSRLLSELLPQARRIADADYPLKVGDENSSLEHADCPIIFDAAPFLRLREASQPGTALLHNWTATSDSIAARLAEVCGADELVLLKSAPPPAVNLQAAADAGFVDAHFPKAAASIAAIRCVDLKDPNFPQWKLEK